MLKIILKDYRVYLFSFSFLILIALIPVFLNWLINHEVSYKVARDNDWIGFHASYLGGIMGGLISGLLTLGGVWLTIDNQKKKDSIDRYPKIRMNADEVLEKIRVISNIDKSLNEGRWHDLHSNTGSITKEKDTLIRLSAEVNGYFYEKVRKLTFLCEDIYENAMLLAKYRVDGFEDEETKEWVKTYESRVKEIESIYNKIFSLHHEILMEYDRLMK
ncbi:hypothetical protein V2H29_03845 [Lysinibacillus fusiformis]|uniref:hypothetical protein n=1 Tax=Lysinibacillus fusiformis TaxID=28031 RepID=UPI002E9EBF63|nr:hypothetical protein [Lysinibacillus fusiformis]